MAFYQLCFQIMDLQLKIYARDVRKKHCVPTSHPITGYSTADAVTQIKITVCDY